MGNEMTIEQKLAAQGYSHSRTANSATTGKHVIARISDGVVMGQMTVREVVEWMAARTEVKL